MTDERRKTIETLIELSRSSDPTGCWDSDRAVRLLQRQSSPEELRAMGVEDEIVGQIWNRNEPADRSTADAEDRKEPSSPAVARGRFTIRVEARFEAAHFLRSYRGVSEPLHGHSYRVEAELSQGSGALDHEAIAVDFVEARSRLEQIAARLDYTCINDVEPFTTLNPSAENIARWFHDELARTYTDGGVRVRSVVVWEGPFNSVRFVPDPE